ncbi:Memo-like protein [uncultured archaeon]|nr:Memo-like protein [uncultured archaeon]
MKKNEPDAARQPAVAGMFYPAKANELAKIVDSFLAKIPGRKFPGKLMAFVSPHAGYIYSGIVAASAFSLLKGLDRKKEWKIILLGPAHQVHLQGAAASGSKSWETPLGRVETTESGLPVSREAHAREHSIEVQIPFLQRTLKKFKITPIVFGEIDAKALAEMLIPLIDSGTIIIASSDLSHYYPYEQALKLDATANASVPALDIKGAEHCEACGLTGILALMHIAKKMKWKGEFLDYKNSGDTAGDMRQVVGYGAYAFYG